MIYYGITIGPIVETLAQATTPGSLWYASYMFSKLTEKMCEKLSEIDGVQIISPYYESNQKCATDNETRDKFTGHCLGYGKYHDRILFAISSTALQEHEQEISGLLHEKIIVSDLIRDIVSFEKTSNGQNAKANSEKEYVISDEDVKFLNSYLQVSYIQMNKDDAMISKKDGVINSLNYYLDCLEMSRTIFTQHEDCVKEANFFQRLFFSVDEAKEGNNVAIKNSKLIQPFMKTDYFTLINNEKKIRSMPELAEYTSENFSNKGLRKSHYVAIVQADGDNMGKYIKSIEKKCEAQGLDLRQEMFHFSEKCMKYTTKSADLIMEYGGIVIFAGGDDLLFLAPIQPAKNKNIYKLIKDISDTFDSVFKEEISQQSENQKRENKLSLSFGVSLNSEKFPLYEAFATVRSLLFSEAKAGLVKNNIAVALRKGNSASFGFKMPVASIAFQKYCEIIGKYYNSEEQNEEEQKRLNSVIYLFENWGNMFAYALEKDNKSVNNVFKNLFDHEIHEYTDDFLEDIKQLAKCVYCQYKSNLTNPIPMTSKVSEDEGIKCIIALLHMAKFMVEKDIDEE